MTRRTKQNLKKACIQWIRKDRREEDASRLWVAGLLELPSIRHFRKKLPPGTSLGQVWKNVEAYALTSPEEAVQANIAAAIEAELLTDELTHSPPSPDSLQRVAQIRFEAAVTRWVTLKETDKFRQFLLGGGKGHVTLNPDPD